MGPHQGAHKPKARPANSLRDKVPLYSKLPRYSGPYKVGFIEIEIPATNPRTFSHIRREHRHVLALETVLFSIYYPAHLRTGDWATTRWSPLVTANVATEAAGASRLGLWEVRKVA